jgi:histidine triad (HIT) family protein
VFLETRHFVAILNISPILPGHTVVFPKRHSLSMLELEDAEMVDLRELLGRLLPGLLKLYGASGYNLAVNCGESAGMSVEHLHLHVIPRRKGDSFQASGIRSLYSALSKEEGHALGSENYEAELQKLKKAFKHK